MERETADHFGSAEPYNMARGLSLMPLLDLQVRYRELGRVRLGKKAPKGNPMKLDTWRLTSASQELLEAGAVVYGGKVQVWDDAPNEGTMYELITETDALKIAVPPGEVLSAFYELWKSGGCKKRCDGRWQILRDVACSCPTDIAERMEKAKDGEACTPALRLSMLLPDIPDVGVWRLESHGYSAAQEIPATYEILRAAANQGTIIPARLKIENRQTKRDGKVHKFRVPVIEIEQKLQEIAAGLGMNQSTDAPAFGAPVQRRALPGTPPPVSTDPGEDRGAMQPAEFPAETELPPPPEPTGLPKWILDLPGTDGDIIDAANAVNHEGGGRKVIKSVAELVDMPEHLRQALAARLENPNQEELV